MAYLVAFVQWLAHTPVSFDLRLLGFFNRVPITACREFMPWAMVGFALTLVSGLVFLTIFPAQYAYSQTWWFKVFFLCLAGANALIFETTMGARMLVMQPGEASPVAFRAIGALSLVSWFFVLYFGRMLPFLGSAY
jgi:hypothetical protein